jgi:aminopeptidase
MTGKLLLAAVGVALVSRPVAAQPKPDYAALAEKLVSTTANVKEGEVVEITTGPNDLAFAEEIAVAVRKRGAYALITYGSEAIAKKVVASVPEKYDEQAPKLALGLVKIVDVHILIPPVRDPAIFDSLSPERRAKQGKEDSLIQTAARKKNIRFIELDNMVAPSPSRAKLYGISEPELTKLFWDGVGADYTAVAEKCKVLGDALAKTTEVKITTASGTDLKLKVKGKKVGISDGMTTDAEIKAKGTNVQVWLPAGEVYLVPGGAEGKIVDDRLLWNGKEATAVTAEVKAGKVTSWSAKSGWDPIKAIYDAAAKGKDLVGVLDFGCNPSLKNAGKLENWGTAGTVTLVVGGNVWAGGNNAAAFGIPLNLSNATVTFDGKTVIENGALK